MPWRAPCGPECSLVPHLLQRVRQTVERVARTFPAWGRRGSLARKAQPYAERPRALSSEWTAMTRCGIPSARPWRVILGGLTLGRQCRLRGVAGICQAPESPKSPTAQALAVARAAERLSITLILLLLL